MWGLVGPPGGAIGLEIARYKLAGAGLRVIGHRGTIALGGAGRRAPEQRAGHGGRRRGGDGARVFLGMAKFDVVGEAGGRQGELLEQGVGRSVT